MQALLNRLAHGLMPFPARHTLFIGTGEVNRQPARRPADWVSLCFVIDQSDYDTVNAIKGGAFYTTLDLTNHLGGEFVIHQANASSGDSVCTSARTR